MRGMVRSAEVERFRSLLAQRLGLWFDDGKLDFLAEVLRQRMEYTGCGQFCSYQQIITASAREAEELRALAEQLTVCETYFFRYADHFRAFAEVVIPDRMEAQVPRRQLRILSAGCASGEEAYSLAILIRDRLPDLAFWEITIRGIDVNVSMLERARRGRYAAWSLRETPADLQSKYFQTDGREFVLDSTLHSMAEFEERNLVEEDPLLWQADAFDVVFCRNVTMYFTPEATRSVISRITQALRPGGFLFLGHAETLRGISQDFHLRHTHGTFYYQRRESRKVPYTTLSPGVVQCSDSAQMPIPAMVEPSDSWFGIIRRASERIVDLTEKRSRSARDASGNVATSTANSHALPPTAVWDRALAIELLRQEKFAEATELLRALPLHSQADPDAQLLLAALLTNTGDLPEAERVCQSLLKLDELNAGAHYLIALCREHLDDQDAAMEHDRVAVYLDSAFAMPHLHIGLIAKRSAEMETARRELSRALALLDREDASRILLFGGGFTREALAEFCRAELRACGGGP